MDFVHIFEFIFEENTFILHSAFFILHSGVSPVNYNLSSRSYKKKARLATCLLLCCYAAGAVSAGTVSSTISVGWVSNISGCQARL